MVKASITKATQRRAAASHNKIAKKAIKTHDSYQNVALALGQGTKNALSASTYGFNPITRIRTLLDWIYRGSWLGSIAVDAVADDMTRAGIEINSQMEPEDMELLRKAEVDNNLWGSINETTKWSRLYGGCIMVMLIDGQDFSTPLRVETITEGQLKGFLVLDRWMVDADLSHLVNELGPNLGKPEWYTVGADAPALRQQRIHYTRVLRMDGMDLPYWQRVQENLWGLSVFERIYDRMVALDSATTGAAQLVYKSFLRTFKMKGLVDLLSQGGAGENSGMAVVARRMAAMAAGQSNEGVTVIDGDDEFDVQSGTSGYTGITDVILQFIQQISGTLGIPLVRMLGQSPAGLNSTGESDLRTYYDGINQQQERTLRRPLEIIYKVMAASKGIALDKDFSFKFAPLWQLDEGQKSEIASRDADTLIKLKEADIIDKPTALRELKQNSRVTNRLDTITEEMIQAAELEPPVLGEIGSMGLSDDEIIAAGGDPTKTKHANPNNDPMPIPSGNRVGGFTSKPSSLDSRSIDSLPGYHVAGLEVRIENMQGTVRKGRGWSVKMPADYGYIPTFGSAEGDTEWMDCFVGPNRDSKDVWIIDALDPRTGKFDEHKCMMGFDSELKAMECFARAYHDGAVRRVGGCTYMDAQTFSAWLRGGDLTRPVAKQTVDLVEAA